MDLRNIPNNEFIASLAKQVEPHINIVTDYFMKENLDGKLGEMVLMWILAMSISVRSDNMNDLLESAKGANDIVKNLSLFFHAIRMQDEGK
jgi:hypothetical protein